MRIATDAARRRYLPETMEHPEVRAECLRLAYLIQAYGLASTQFGPNYEVTKVTRFSATGQREPPAVTHGSGHRGRVTQTSRALELADA